MAGGKLKNRQLIPASTVLEVVISMIIIIVVFGIGMMIFSNVSRLSLSGRKIKAQAILQDALFEAERSTERGNKTLTVDELTVKQEVTAFENEPSLSVITLTAFDPNHEQIAQLKRVIENHEKAQ